MIFPSTSFHYCRPWNKIRSNHIKLSPQSKDMVRISDARMSGTAFGTVVLHVSPESAMGGPINFVEDGDIITLDVHERKLSIDVSDEELEQRKSLWVSPPPPPTGYARLFHDSIEGT